jgi:hypothetical protein
VAKGNTGAKLTERKIKGIVRDKINNNSTKWVAWEWKVSESTVKRIWIYWTKYHELLPRKMPGRKKTVLDEYQVDLILEVHKEQNLGARRLEKISNTNMASIYLTMPSTRSSLITGCPGSARIRKVAGKPGSGTNAIIA